jgi:hypothetical protein
MKGSLVMESRRSRNNQYYRGRNTNRGGRGRGRGRGTDRKINEYDVNFRERDSTRVRRGGRRGYGRSRGGDNQNREIIGTKEHRKDENGQNKFYDDFQKFGFSTAIYLDKQNVEKVKNNHQEQYGMLMHEISKKINNLEKELFHRKKVFDQYDKFIQSKEDKKDIYANYGLLELGATKAKNLTTQAENNMEIATKEIEGARQAVIEQLKPLKKQVTPLEKNKVQAQREKREAQAELELHEETKRRRIHCLLAKNDIQNLRDETERESEWEEAYAVLKK